jgi:hypothetical protein
LWWVPGIKPLLRRGNANAKGVQFALQGRGKRGHASTMSVKAATDKSRAMMAATDDAGLWGFSDATYPDPPHNKAAQTQRTAAKA